MSAVIGCLGGLNSVSLKKIILFSSISHLGWILSIICLNKNIIMYYFTLYRFILLTIVYSLKATNLVNLKDIFKLKSNINKHLLVLNIISLAGLPPFRGFVIKIASINILLLNSTAYLLFFLIMATVISLFFYIRLAYLRFIIPAPIKLFVINYYKHEYFIIFINLFSLLTGYILFVLDFKL